MRAVVQRVAAACVRVDGHVVGAIGRGLLALVGIAVTDTAADAEWLADKLTDLRIFADDQGRFDKSLRETQGELLIVSQFTLLADTRRGRRPSFTAAARPAQARPLVERVAARARARGVRVATGQFGAHMEVELINDGPVTLVLDSAQR